jgi:DNA-binding CsgD family transcriptional regulator
VLTEEYIEQSNRALTVDELFELYRAALADLGIDQIVFSLMTDHVELDKPAGHGLLSNYPASWMQHYVEQQYAWLDPVRHCMYAAGGPFAWKKLIERLKLSKRQKRFFGEAADAGLVTGFGIPLRGPHGAIAGFGLASSDRHLDLDRNALCRINLLSQQFYQVFQSLERIDRPADLVRLSDRERDILQWCAHGNTRVEIAALLRISENTVDYHLRNVYLKLKAGNITVAVLKALHCGLIQL